jgi:hypothetical protein
LGAKFFDDAYYNNAYYAKVGGVLVSEMNGLEVDFLFRINFSLHVTPDVFQKYRAELLSQACSAGVDISFPTPAPVHAPQQVHPMPVMQRQQTPAPLVSVQYSDQHTMLMHQSHNSLQNNATDLLLVTPSPTALAGRIVDEAMNMSYHHNQMATAPADCFPTVQRTNSEPVMPNFYRSHSRGAMRCSQNQSFSAPPIPAVALQYPVEDPYVVMDHHIYPVRW